VSTDRQVYAPGDKVEFEVEIRNSLTGELIKDDDARVNVFVTDEQVFSNIETDQQPPSFVTQVYLEHEVLGNDYEIYNSDDYIEQMFNATKGEMAGASDRNLDLLLSV